MVTTDRGDVRELLDSGGKAFAHYAYDVWGNPTATLTAATIGVDATLAAAVASRQVLRYAGYTWDAETSLYYCLQRYYDPRTACFLSKDPARDDGEESAYQYCAGDPVGNVDPTGLKTMRNKYTKWQSIGGSALLGGVAGMEWRARGIWQKRGRSIRVGVEMAVRNGRSFGGAFIIGWSKITGTAWVKKSLKSSAYRKKLGTLNVDLSTTKVEGVTGITARGTRWSPWYEKYWPVRANATASVNVTGGLYHTGTTTQTSRTFYNRFGKRRPGWSRR